MNTMTRESGELYQLTVQSGAMPGATWVVRSTPLIIGRSRTCHVVLTDDLVSRTHCSVQRMGDGLRLRDLGSSNPCLVNGKPCTSATLHPGDRLAVGDTVFLVSMLLDGLAAEHSTPGKADTLRLDDAQIPLLRTVSDPAQLERLPKTAREYALLFQFGLECAACTDSAALYDRLVAWLRQCFDAGVIALHLRQADALALALEEPREAEPLPEALVQSVLEDRRARMMPLDAFSEVRINEGHVMLCPLVVSGDGVGVLSVASVRDGRAYFREDLEFFGAIAHVFAPYLHAVSDRETLRKANVQLRNQITEGPLLLGKSTVLHAVRALLTQAAMAEDLPVLLLGETGTGKELAARLIHRGSSRGHREMIVVNCAAIPDELFESEFFGHVRGAFTGATGNYAGLVAAAQRSTLFLDEIAELNMANQAKLLRFVETGQYRPVGEARERPADVRIIAATNKPLPSDGFRMDLYHRLSGFIVVMPPLRAHPEDIPVLAEHFRATFAVPGGPAGEGMSEEALDTLTRASWPGNVRELRQRIHRAVRTAAGPRIEANNLVMDQNALLDELAPGELVTLADMEKEHIIRVLGQCNGDTARAAAILGIARSTMYKKIHDYGLR